MLLGNDYVVLHSDQLGEINLIVPGLCKGGNYSILR